MKPLLTAILSIIVFSTTIYAQSNIDNVLLEVEKNNTKLIALRKQADAEKIGNKTGIYLQNPEAEFHYLWGSPAELGNRKDISIKQTFDFPSAYRYKNQISNARNEQVELEFQKQRKALLLQTRLICIDLVFYNSTKVALSKRSDHAQNIATSFKTYYEAGETGILEYNKAQLNLLYLKKEIESIDLKRNTLLSELKVLNGGIDIAFIDSAFQTPLIPGDFEEWYVMAEQKNPILSWLKQEIEISERQKKLNNAMSLPKLQAGYMSESVVGTKFQGVTVGLSIPLWENKNTVKYVKAQTLALQSIETDNKLEFYNHLKSIHTKTVDLRISLEDYRKKLEILDNTDLLLKALDKGEISLIDYILELSIYYKSVNQLLELEREMHQALAELNQYL